VATLIKKQLNRNEQTKTVTHDAVRQLQQANNDLVNNDIPSAILTTQGDLLIRSSTGPSRLAAGTSGYLLQSNGSTANTSWVAPPPTPAWTVVGKTSDETRSASTALTADGSLSFAVTANIKYRFRFHAFYDTGNTADIAFDVNGPASPTNVQYSIEPNLFQDSAYQSGGNAFASKFTNTNSGTGGTQSGLIRIVGILQNGSNAGTLAFRWAQNTSSSGATTVFGGSYVEYATV